MSRRKRLLWVLAGCPLLGGAMLGCASDPTSPSTGSLLVRWGGELCNEGVTRLSLAVAGPTEAAARSETAVCSPGEFRFQDLPAGTYTPGLSVQFLGAGDAGPVQVVIAGGTKAVTSQTFAFHIDAGAQTTVRISADPVDPPGDESEPGPDMDLPPQPDAPSDVDGDGIPDGMYDNCNGVFNPDQIDSDNDNAGNACDCAPTDADIQDTVLDDELIVDSGQFTPVDGAWSYLAGVYHQTDANDLARSWRPTDDLEELSIDTSLAIAGMGSTGALGSAFAGVALRASGFATGPAAGQAYVCGTDGANVLIAALDAGAGTLTTLASATLPFALASSAPLYASAKLDMLVCRITNPADAGDAVQVSASDTTFASGSTGLVTNGMAADFSFARICGE